MESETLNRENTACCDNGVGRTLWRQAAAMLCRLTALVGVVAVLAPSATALGAVRKQADFNGDGYADLAIGAPGEDYWFNLPTGTTHINDAGVVHVVYGWSGGLAYGRNQLLSRASESPYSIYRPAFYARFGNAFTWGDFNHDGYDDLAIGVPGDRSNLGSVDIYYGSASGLSYRAGQILTQSQMPGTVAKTSYEFGWALAAGDVNRDGYAELAISQLYSTLGKGAVYVVPGSATGLRTASAQTFNYFTIYGPLSLAFGDFNGDGYFDLAMGLPSETIGSIYYTGMVLVAYGSPYRLSLPQLWSQDSPGIPGVCEKADNFGYALAAADFNDDGKWDLAIGAPGENSNAGVVHVLFGQSGGLDTWATQLWSQDSANVYDVPEPGDRFGESLAAANVQSSGNSYRFPELIVGIPGENAGAGAIQVLPVIAYYSTIYQFWNQDSYQVLGMCEAGDRFGSSLAVGDFNGNGLPDVAIGVAGENTSVGAVNVLFGAGSGLSWMGNQILMQGIYGVLETQETYDAFGRL